MKNRENIFYAVVAACYDIKAYTIYFYKSGRDSRKECKPVWLSQNATVDNFSDNS